MTATCGDCHCTTWRHDHCFAVFIRKYGQIVVSMNIVQPQRKDTTKICSDYKILSTHWHHGASPDLRFSALLKATSRKVHRKFNATYTFSIVNLEELSRITQEKVMNSSKKMPKRLVYKVGIKKTAKEAQRIFKWNSVGDDYIFWQDGHLYYSDTAESTTSIQISGGGPNWEHGIFDWVYEEEIFGRGSKSYTKIGDALPRPHAKVP
ncbi:hypothetical protein ANCCEY_09043 [Ancylostoma ceylanicum]|uniref:Dipeptidylpeptidase IV N-terminal domain-containing protein n=1 Tax=Ancylostoma ceylanicum TaxID=53326 RepID=A0A0D6LW47_9BILA|nr:hypothetical protein ANCCEY_09043 [Ancylostoma ceylanicum]